MNIPITKSSGTNKSERHLTSLCEKTFLSLWSYPNPYRDSSSGPNREICDLLVVCDNSIIIFSDKCCDFGNSGSLALDWERWRRRTIEAGGKQAFGAERMLRNFPDRVFTDATCKHHLPPKLPPSPKMRVHRIVVARGAKNNCRTATGLSGSLILAPGELTGDAPHPPFVIGDPFPDRGFVHILDDVTLELLLKELDTITDFLDYLEEKETFIRGNRLYQSFGEENLLAWYLQRMREDGSRHEIYCPTGQQLLLKGTEWIEFSSSADRTSRNSADRIAYAWDELIETFSRCLFNGTLVMHDARSAGDIEHGLRIMAKERRLGRRGLAAAVADALHVEAGNKAFVRSISSSKNESLFYVFAICPKNGMDDETYARMRRDYLSDYCYVLSSRNRQIKTVVGIGMQPLNTSENGNFDMVVMKSPDWNDERVKEAEEIRKSWGFQSDHSVRRWEKTNYEYPSEIRKDRRTGAAGAKRQLTRSKSHRIGRNNQCPCGSGKKYKHCCLR